MPPQGVYHPAAPPRQVIARFWHYLTGEQRTIADVGAVQIKHIQLGGCHKPGGMATCRAIVVCLRRRVLLRRARAGHPDWCHLSRWVVSPTVE